MSTVLIDSIFEPFIAFLNQKTPNPRLCRLFRVQPVRHSSPVCAHLNLEEPRCKLGRWLRSSSHHQSREGFFLEGLGMHGGAMKSSEIHCSSGLRGIDALERLFSCVFSKPKQAEFQSLRDGKGDKPRDPLD